jgi:hypothetical protein
MEPIQEKFKNKIKEILYFTFLADEVEIEINGETINEELLLMVSSYENFIKGFGKLAELKFVKIGKDESFVNPLDGEVYEPFSWQEELTFQIKILLEDLVFEAHHSLSEPNALVALEIIKSEIRRFQVLVLDELPHYRIRRYGVNWGRTIPTRAFNVLKKYITLEEDAQVYGDFVVCDKLAEASLKIIAEIIPAIVNRIESVQQVLRADGIQEPTVNNNGIFYHHGEKQEALITSFLSYANSKLIEPEQLEDWVNLLAGKSIPQKPVVWLGVKTHLVYLLKSGTELRAIDKTRPLPIEYVSGQVPWKDIKRSIQFPGGQGWGSGEENIGWQKLSVMLKKTGYYINEFMESYKGEY